MAVRGSGPSRRSHTKSRKGCKTCKRRHIRCDESFPQCRNCTKHHVRCDYQDASTPEIDGIHPPKTARVSSTPTSDDAHSASYYCSDASYVSDSSYMVGFDAEQSYGNNPELIHNLRAIADALDARGAGDLSVWVPFIRRNIQVAATNPFLMDALKAFSAGQIAWISQSPAAREQSIDYSTSALSGLHQAVGHFSKENADAVLATSLNLVSQSRDWLSWSSLESGITSITTAMAAWESESLYSDIIKHYNQSAANKATNPGPPAPVPTRDETLSRMMSALQLLSVSVSHRPLEAHWVSQFIDLVTRLQTTGEAKTEEEQFNHLYVLRKWLLWLPITLLQDGMVDEFNLAVIANLYAMAIALSANMSVANSLVSLPAAIAIDRVFRRFEQLQPSPFQTVDMSGVFFYPRQMFEYYCSWNAWAIPQKTQETLLVPSIATQTLEDPHNTSGNLSPAFTPAAFSRVHHRASSSASAFLAVPSDQGYYFQPGGLGANTSQWATFPSPSFPSVDTFGDDNFNSTMAFPGYTLPCEIWT